MAARRRSARGGERAHQPLHGRRGAGAGADREEVLRIVEVAAPLPTTRTPTVRSSTSSGARPGTSHTTRANNVLAEAHARCPDLVRPRGLGVILDVSLVDMPISAGHSARTRAALEAIERNRSTSPRDRLAARLRGAGAAVDGPAAARVPRGAPPARARHRGGAAVLPMVAVLCPPTPSRAGPTRRGRSPMRRSSCGTRAAAAFSAVPIARGLARSVRTTSCVATRRPGRAGPTAPIDGRLACRSPPGGRSSRSHEGRAPSAVAACVRVPSASGRTGWLYDAPASTSCSRTRSKCGATRRSADALRAADERLLPRSAAATRLGGSRGGARRSSSPRPRRLSRRSKRPAQSDDFSPPTRARRRRETFERRTSTASSR